MNKITLAIFYSIIIFFISSELNNAWLRYVLNEVVFSNYILFAVGQNAVKIIVYLVSGYFVFRFSNEKQLLIILLINTTIGAYEVFAYSTFSEMASFLNIFMAYMGGIIPSIFLLVGYGLNKNVTFFINDSTFVYQAHTILNLVIIYIGIFIIYYNDVQESYYMSTEEVCYSFLAWEVLTIKIWRKKIIFLFTKKDNADLSLFPFYHVIMPLFFYNMMLLSCIPGKSNGLERIAGIVVDTGKITSTGGVETLLVLPIVTYTAYKILITIEGHKHSEKKIYI